jgi:uncharacterized protein (TIGR03084 family)
MRPADLPAAAGLAAGPPDEGAPGRRARDWGRLVVDLTSLGAELEQDLAELSRADGEVESLCPGWTVRDVVVHLVVGDGLALRALAGEDCFPDPTEDEAVLARESRQRVGAWGSASIDEAVAAYVAGRRRLLDVIADLPVEDRRARVPWAARPISRFALVQSRLMETWVHGRDLRLPLGLSSPYDDRCWWVNDLGVRHVPYALAKAGVELALSGELLLDGPGGGTWQFGAAGTAGEPVTLAGPSWAWLVAVAQRAPARADALAHLIGPDVASPVATTARAFA